MLNNKIIKRNSPIIGVLLMSALSQLTHAETGNYFMHWVSTTPGWTMPLPTVAATLR